MIDVVIRFVWKLGELVIVLAIFWWLISFFGIPQAVLRAIEAHERRKQQRMRIASNRDEAKKRIRARMLRDSQGRFVEKVPDPMEPHDPEELARIEAEIERELRNGRR